MRSRRKILAAAVAVVAFLLAAAVAAGWELRRKYERDLAARVWSSGAVSGSPTVAGSGSPTILFLGDSRLAQWELGGVTRGRYVNAAMSGATTAEVRAAALALLEKYRPDVVVIEAGINDLKLLGMRPDLREKVAATVRDNLAALVKACREAGSKVLLLTIWPPTRPELLRRFVWGRAVPESVEEINRALPALVGSDPGVAVIDLFSEGVRPIYRDTLHLDPQTYRELTPRLERHVEGMLDRS